MTPIRIFVSSVQKEFAREREALRDYLCGDPLMRQFFDVFLFEDIPAADKRPDEFYLDEVERCDLYVGLFGNDYGMEDEKGLSPTEREFNRATASGAHRLIFVKGTDDDVRHPMMLVLIGKAQAGLIRKRFNTPGRTGGWSLRGVGGLPESQRIDPLGAIRCGILHGCRNGRSRV